LVVHAIVLLREVIDVSIEFKVHFFVFGILFAMHIDCVFELLDTIVRKEVVFIDIVYDVVGLPCSCCESFCLGLFCFELVEIFTLLVQGLFEVSLFTLESEIFTLFELHLYQGLIDLFLEGLCNGESFERFSGGLHQ
jgi:hypothetical protein